jgi:hypothetical protein
VKPMMPVKDAPSRTDHDSENGSSHEDRLTPQTTADQPPVVGRIDGMDLPFPGGGEPFEPAEVAARFLGTSRRELLAMARRGIPGAYPLDATRKRKTWVFRLSELAAAITGGYTISKGSSR